MLKFLELHEKYKDSSVDEENEELVRHIGQMSSHFPNPSKARSSLTELHTQTKDKKVFENMKIVCTTLSGEERMRSLVSF